MVTTAGDVYDDEMDTVSRFSWMEILGLLLVVACAAGARGWFVAVCAGGGETDAAFAVQVAGPRGTPAGTAGPQTDIAELAHNLQTERWFGCRAPLADHAEETAHVAPGYPWLLGMAGRLTDQPGQAVRWVQCILGALTAAGYFLFARRAFGGLGVASLAGLLVAFDPFAIINAAELADGALCSFLLVAALGLGTRGSQEGGAFVSLLYGLSLAALAMVRAALLPFAVVAFLWYLLCCRQLRSGGFAGLLALLGFANGLAPWALRNWQAFEEPLPVVDSAYLHLWVGNNPLATGSSLDETMLRRSLPPQLLGDLLAETDQPLRYARLGPAVLAQIANDPAAALGHRIDAGLCFTLGGNWLRDRRLALVRTGTGETAAPSWVAESVEACLRGSLLVMILLGVLGWRFSAAWARRSQLAVLAAVWLPLPYLLSHAEDLSGPRLPLDGVLLCYAAFALVCLVPGFAWTPAQAGAAAAEESPAP